MIKIFRQLEGNENVVMGADPGEGISYCAGIVISKQHNDIPIVYHARVESPQFGYDLNSLGLYIKKKTGHVPLLAVERNIGAATIEKLRNVGYPLAKLYKQKSVDRVTNKEEERIGWVTTASNRRRMLDDLAMCVRNKGLKIYDEEIISEMLTFVVRERTGQPQPENGTFSDLIMATAICYQMTKIDTGSAHWSPAPKPANSKFLPKKADGFIVEKFDPNAGKDWKSA